MLVERRVFANEHRVHVAERDVDNRRVERNEGGRREHRNSPRARPNLAPRHVDSGQLRMKILVAPTLGRA
jgi:hypothetical protein